MEIFLLCCSVQYIGKSFFEADTASSFGADKNTTHKNTADSTAAVIISSTRLVIMT